MMRGSRLRALGRLRARGFYALHERLVGRPTFGYLRELEASQWLDRPALEQLQSQKLQGLLQLAWTHCPWHQARMRAAGLDPRAPLGLSDLSRLPTMDKADARAHGQAMRWPGVPGGAQAYTTGGSSGEPLRFYFGRRRQASDTAGRMRARQWWGVPVGAREVYLWGAPVELDKTDRIKQFRDRLLNQLVLNAFEMSPRRMDAYCALIEDYNPLCVYGYASSLALLAAHALERGRRLRLPALRVVCTTGEPLYPHQRELIGQAFGVPVANEFGSRDIGFTAHESPAGQMLLMSESHVLEVLDEAGRPVTPGESGEAVVTGLESQAQPFIRYRTGDVVRVGTEACREGRALHVLAEVVGRSTDFLIRPDGTIMHALAAIYVLRAEPGVSAFKLIQHTPIAMQVLVVPGSGWSEAGRHRIVEGLGRRMGPDVRVTLECVEAIAPESSGKHRYVVSHVGLPGALGTAAQSGHAA